MANKILTIVATILRQKSTWVGITAIVTALGAPEIGIKIGDVGNAVILVLGGLGIGLDNLTSVTSTS